MGNNFVATKKGTAWTALEPCLETHQFIPTPLVSVIELIRVHSGNIADPPQIQKFNPGIFKGRLPVVASERSSLSTSKVISIWNLFYSNTSCLLYVSCFLPLYAWEALVALTWTKPAGSRCCFSWRFSAPKCPFCSSSKNVVLLPEIIKLNTRYGLTQA